MLANKKEWAGSVLLIFIAERQAIVSFLKYGVWSWKKFNAICPY